MLNRQTALMRIFMASVAVSCAASCAAVATAPEAGAQEECYEFSPASSDIGTSCYSLAENPAATGIQSGIAYYNAARAYASSGDAINAALAASKSYDRLSDDAVLQIRNPHNGGFGRRRARGWEANRNSFRLGRALAYAQSFTTLAGQDDLNTNSAARNICFSKEDCLSKAANKLGEVDPALLNLFEANADQARDPRYNEFFFVRGKTYAVRGGPTDTDDAINDFEEVLSGSITPYKAEARAELITVAESAGEKALDTGATQQAIQYFEAAKRADPNSASAYVGVGDAYLVYAKDTTATRSQRAGYFAIAETQFSEATRYSTGVEQASAYLKLGQTQALWAQLLEQQANPRQDEINQATSLKARSLASYRNAANIAGDDPEMLSTLAAALADERQWSEAAEAYQKAIGLKLNYPDWTNPLNLTSLGSSASMLLSQERRALSVEIVALADVQARRSGLVQPTALQLYQAAETVDGNNVRATLKIGVSHYQSGNEASLGDARQALLNVIMRTGGANGPASPGREAERAEAYYYLSQVEAKNAGSNNLSSSMARSVDYAKAAYSLDASNSLYHKNVCLAHILRGNSSVTDRANSGWCSGLVGAEGLLLRGMFGLRHAQYAPQSQSVFIRDTAQFAFAQGKTVLANEQQAGEVLQPNLRWPGITEQAPPLQDLLEFGRAQAIACGGVTSPADLSRERITAAAAFFSAYKVGSCGRN